MNELDVLWHGLPTVPRWRITIQLSSLRRWAGRETGPQRDACPREEVHCSLPRLEFDFHLIETEFGGWEDALGDGQPDRIVFLR